MYEELQYSRPFLKEVIARVDFAVPVEPLGKTLPPRLVKAAMSQFPISEPRELFNENLQIGVKEITHRRDVWKEWNYYGREREKRLAICPVAFFTSYAKYSSYEKLRDEFFAVLEVLFSQYPDTKASRLGLRYINAIEIAPMDPFEWSDYIDNSLLCLLSHFRTSETTRIFHIVEFKYETLQVKFQFGLPNPDFPAQIRKPHFVLDFDGYAHGPDDLQGIRSALDQAHERIQALFETSITGKLRKKMNES